MAFDNSDYTKTNVKYVYSAVLQDGTVVNGSYIGSEESSQTIKVQGASSTNRIVKMTLKKEDIKDIK